MVWLCHYCLAFVVMDLRKNNSNQQGSSRLVRGIDFTQGIPRLEEESQMLFSSHHLLSFRLLANGLVRQIKHVVIPIYQNEIQCQYIVLVHYI